MASKKYDYKFITEPSDTLICFTCSKLAQAPKQHEKCGKVFCSECIKKNEKTCPNCKTLNPINFTDTRGIHEIRELRVKCDNVAKGCDWEGTVGTLQNHLITSCLLKAEACKYKNIGCEMKLTGEDLKKHEENDDKVHLHLLLEKTAKIDVFRLITQSEQKHRILREGESTVFNVPGYSSKKENNHRFYSHSFYTFPGGYKMRVRVDANGDGSGMGTHVSVYAHLLEGPFDNSLHWPFMGTVTFELLNQLANHNHCSRILHYTPERNVQIDSLWGFAPFIPHYALSHDPISNTQYLMDDTLYFRVTVRANNHKPWLVSRERVNTHFLKAVKDFNTLKEGESMTFKVSGYSRRKGLNNKFLSDPFYTSSCGYKMCIEVDVNGVGDSNGTHVSVFTNPLKGPYDDILNWPFQGTVTYELLNQLTDKNHHRESSNFTAIHDLRANNSRGYIKFISHSELFYNAVNRTQYLMDDTLYFRVTVKVNNHKPWLVCTHHTK